MVKMPMRMFISCLAELRSQTATSWINNTTGRPEWTTDILMRTTWTFSSAAQLVFGRNAVHQLGDLARSIPAKKIFVVTDAILAKAGVLEPVHASLSQAGIRVGIFEGGQAEPSLKLADECAAAARKFGPDAVLGLGGGSYMDVAKMAGFLLTHGGKAADYIGDSKVRGPILP